TPRSARLTDFVLPSNVEPEQHHVAVLDDVLLALGPNDALFAGALPAAGGHKLVIADSLAANEAALEIGVNDTGGDGRRVALMDRPGPDLLLAGGEIRLQAQQTV